MLKEIRNVFIPPSGNLAVHLQFEPRVCGNHTATLRIFNNDTARSKYDVVLEGNTLARPRIRAHSDSLFFPAICVDSYTTLPLEIFNEGCAVLTIFKFEFSDSAFSTEADSIDIGGNDSTIINIKFSPKRIGDSTATLGIVSNDPHPDRDTLRVPLSRMGIAPQIGGEPKLIFDSTVVKAPSSKTYVIHNPSQCTLRIDSLATKNGEDSTFYFCRPDTIERHFVEPNSSLEVCLRFAPQDTGKHIDSLFIYSNDLLLNPYKVRLEGMAVPCIPQITVDPDSLAFGEVCIDSSRRMSLAISNDRCADFRATISFSDSAFRAELDTVDLAPDSTNSVMVTFYPKRAKEYLDTLTITSSDPNKRSWQIRLRGRGLGSNIDGDSLADLGYVKVGEQKTIPYPIVNSGRCDLQIFMPVISGKDSSDFSDCTKNVNWPAIIRPSESLSLSLCFTPGDIGWRNATLKIYNNDADENPLEVQLRGFGLDSCNSPAISHKQPMSPDLGSEVKIFASVSEGCGGIASFVLKYREGGRPAFTSQNFSGDEAIIPKEAVTKRGVEYCIEAIDGTGKVAWLPAKDKFYSLQVKLAAGALPPLVHHGGTAQSSYRLRSFPLEFKATPAHEAFGNNFNFGDHYSARLWGIDTAKAELLFPYIEHPRAGNLKHGRAIFLITSQDKEMRNLEGLTVRTDMALEIALHKGWNLVASPFNFDIPFRHSSLDSFGGRAFAYEGAWEEINSSYKFKPWEGLAIKAPKADTLKIWPREAASNNLPKTSAVPARAGADWSIRINAFCQEAKDLINIVGVAPDAAEEWDAYELLEPPPIGDYVLAYFFHRNWQKYPDLYTTDFRPPSAKGYEWEFRAYTNMRGEAVNLQFENINSVPQTLQVKLLDVDLNFSQDLRREPVYGFRSSDVEGQTRLFRLVVGNNEYVESKLPQMALVPTSFELSPNFPNPFNPATTFKFGLPKPASVSFVIFNIKGEVVRTLLDEQEKDAGYYLLVWDGRDNLRKSVASGVYFYQLKTREMILTRKMALAK